MMRIVIGTRGSALALVQAKIVAEALSKIRPKIDLSIRVIETHGDVDQRPIPLDQVGKGWFTKEIEAELLGGTVDIAVHSLKDMSEEAPAGLIIDAYLPRGDARDCLVTKDGGGLEALPAGAIVGTDSIRRKLQLLSLRSDLKVKSIRGNVETRLKKLETGTYHAVVLAVAGLERLGLANDIAHIFEPDQMTPAPGQGILAVQVREDDSELRQLLAEINDPDAARAAHIERDFSRMAEGGCKAPVGAYAWHKGNTMHLMGMVEDNGRIKREEMSAPLEESRQLGETLAKRLLKK